MAESDDESINCNAVGDVTFTVTLFDVGLSAANWPTGLNVAVIVSDPNASVEVVSVACAWPLTFVNGTGALRLSVDGKRRGSRVAADLCRQRGGEGDEVAGVLGCSGGG